MRPDATVTSHTAPFGGIGLSRGEIGPQSRNVGRVFRLAYLVAAGKVGFFPTNQAELKGQFQTFLWMYAV